jgi:deoxyadenosine/deoxycytidine kinase
VTRRVHARDRQYEYMDEEHSDEYMDDTIKQYEYMDEEHSDEYMDDTTTINTSTCTRNIVTSTWTIQS